MLLTTTAALADTIVDVPANRVVITGEITADDAAAIKHARRNAVVSLDSTGGSVYAALAMGRLMRERTMTVEVEDGASCFSSCALLYMAGVVRHNDGVVGLHRPYLVGTPHSARRIERALPRMFDDVREFLADMGIRGQVAEIMLHTPPHEIRRFEGAAIAALVPSVDPVYDEIRIAREARALAVTTDAYRRLEMVARQACAGRGGPDVHSCLGKVVVAPANERSTDAPPSEPSAPLAGSVD